MNEVAHYYGPASVALVYIMCECSSYYSPLREHFHRVRICDQPPQVYRVWTIGGCGTATTLEPKHLYLRLIRSVVCYATVRQAWCRVGAPAGVHPEMVAYQTSKANLCGCYLCRTQGSCIHYATILFWLLALYVQGSLLQSNGGATVHDRHTWTMLKRGGYMSTFFTARVRCEFLYISPQREIYYLLRLDNCVGVGVHIGQP